MMEAFYYRHETLFMWTLGAWVAFLVFGAVVALGRSSRFGRARVIIPSVAAFGIIASSIYELLFGDGLRGVPLVALAATGGGLFWGGVIAAAVSLTRPRASKA